MNHIIAVLFLMLALCGSVCAEVEKTYNHDLRKWVTRRDTVVTEMTPEKIKEAIEYGKRVHSLNGYPLCDMNPFEVWGSPSFRVGNYSTPFIRVAVAANTAKRKYKPFTEADVTPEMIAPELHVCAFPMIFGANIIDIETIIIMPHNGKDQSLVIRPTEASELSGSYKNIFGFSAEGKGLLAKFPVTALDEDVDVHLLTPSGSDISFRIQARKWGIR